MTSTLPRKRDGRAGAYADTFAGQRAHTIGPLLDAIPWGRPDGLGALLATAVRP
jgi:hypothetical protein